MKCNRLSHLRIIERRWVLLILLFLFLSSALYAQSSIDNCKAKMIENINKGDFATALQYITCVKDWSFDTQNTDLWFDDISPALDFESYADSMGVAEELCDKVLLYLRDQCDAIVQIFYSQGRYEDALTFANFSAEIVKYVLGEEDPNYATSLTNFGAIYIKMGDYVKAEKYYIEALRIQKSTLGEQHINYTITLTHLGALYDDLGNYIKAEQYYIKALQIQEIVVGEENLNYTISLNNLGMLYQNTGKYDKAKQYYTKALRLQKKVLGERDHNYVTLLNNLGSLYFDIGDYTKAEQYYTEALEIRKVVLGEQHPDYATSLNNLGLLYMAMGEYSKAEQYYTEALQTQKDVLGEKNLTYAVSLNNLGVLYSSMGNYAKAEQYHRKVLQIRESILGKQHPDYAASLCNLGRINATIGNYGKAEQYYIEAIQIERVVYGVQHPDYATLLTHIGALYSDMGDYVKAEQYDLEALQVYKSVLGEQHPYYANLLNNIGALYDVIGNYKEAEQYYIKALQIRKTVLGEQHPDYATSLNNIATFYTQIGDYAKAEQYHMNALKIQRSVLGENHIEYALSLNNLGSLYSDMGEYQKSIQYYLAALQIRKSVLGAKHLDYATSLNNIAAIYVHTGDYVKAEQYFLEALQIQKEILGEQHPVYATTLNNLGYIYSDMGDYAKAAQYDLAALHIRKSILGEQHPDYVASLSNLGVLYLRQGNFINAESYLSQVAYINKNLFIESTDYMTEQQREKYWSTMQTWFYTNYPIFSYYYSILKPNISTFAYDNELFTKGLLLNSSNAVRSSILESGDTTLIRQWNELTAKKQQIQVLEEKDPQSEYLKLVQAEAEQLEKQVTQSSAAFRESKARWAITWDSVRNHLAYNEVAIEYFVAPLSEDSAMYCALLLRHDSEYPALVPLFEEKEVAALVNVSTGNQTNFTYSYDAYGEEICHRVWDKILPYVHEGETIYFSPAGLLHQLAIEALPYDENHTLADVYHLVRLSSTREIAMRHTASKHNTATLYGGIEYDMTDTELLAASSPYQQTNLLASRGIDNDTLNRGNVQYLEGTLHEVENIYSMLVGNRSHRIKAQLYKAKAGNEESFKSLSGKRQNILHIATHGFFWTDAVAQRKELFTQRSLMMSFDGNRHTHPTIDPLTRCGLLLAGANTALSGHSADLPEGVQDGILTAKEISLMDLREADLVVLSACETGRGEITSEGVFGLQRAFKLAGVQTIVMSLWKVSDAATQLLMTEFYRNWLTLGQAKREAFLNAQNTVRQQYPNPEFWAGFVMID